MHAPRALPMLPSKLAERHPVTAYAGLTLLWSYACWALIFTQVRPGGLGAGAPPAAFALAAAGAFGPLVAGLTLTHLVDGPQGFSRLRSRLSYRHLGRWWLALLIPPAMNLLLWALYRARFGAASIDIAQLGPAIGVGVFAALCEEPGWRGFALPHLRERYSPRASALLLGGLWGLWHAFGNYAALGGKGWISAAAILVTAPLLLTPFSILMTWIFENTGRNLLISMLFHAAISSSGFLFGVEPADPIDNLRWKCIVSAAWWLPAAAVLLRPQSSRAKDSSVPASPVAVAAPGAVASAPSRARPGDAASAPACPR